MGLKEKLDRQQRVASITAGEGGPPPEVQEKIDDKKDEGGGDETAAKKCDSCGGALSDDGSCANCSGAGKAEGDFQADDLDDLDDDDEFDLDGFDLADITGVEDEGDGDGFPFDDDYVEGEAEQDHETGEQGGVLMVEDPPPASRDDGVMPITDESEITEGALEGEDDAGLMPLEEDPEELTEGMGDCYASEDNPFDGDMPEDEDDMTTAQWFESFVAAGLVDAAMGNLPITSQRDAIRALSKKGYARGAKFIQALATKDFVRLQKTMLPVYRETNRIAAVIRDGEESGRKIVAALARGGQKKNAVKVKRELAEAKVRDIAEAKLDCPITPMISRRVDAFRKRREVAASSGTTGSSSTSSVVHVRVPPNTSTSKMQEIAARYAAGIRQGKPNRKQRRQAAAVPIKPAKTAKSMVAGTYLAIAQSCAELVANGTPKTAARAYLGKANTDTVRAVQLVAAKVKAGDLEKAVTIVADLIRVATTSPTNPELNPTVMDPKSPVPGSGAHGPMPDAGFSFGMDDVEVRKAMSLLGVTEEPEYLRWVATLPKTTEGQLDTTGSVGVYEDSPGGAVRELPYTDAKAYLQSRMRRRAVLLVDPNDIQEIQASDVRMLLQASVSEDPFYTVIIQGMPVGEVHLADQANQAEIRDVFVDDKLYGRGVADSIARMGAAHTLEVLAYRPYVTAYSQTEEVEKIRTLAAQIAETEIARQVEERTANTIDLMLLAHEGVRRNVYPIEDPLKYALYEGLKEAGVREASIAGIIEGAINMPLAPEGDTGEPKAALTWYLQILAGKASEFQAMSHETLTAVAAQITEAPVRMRTGAVAGSTAVSLKDRLQAASQHYTAIPDNDARTAQNVEENLRTVLNIGRRR